MLDSRAIKLSKPIKLLLRFCLSNDKPSMWEKVHSKFTGALITTLFNHLTHIDLDQSRWQTWVNARGKQNIDERSTAFQSSTFRSPFQIGKMKLDYSSATKNTTVQFSSSKSSILKSCYNLRKATRYFLQPAIQQVAQKHWIGASNYSQGPYERTLTG